MFSRCLFIFSRAPLSFLEALLFSQWVLYHLLFFIFFEGPYIFSRGIFIFSEAYLWSLDVSLFFLGVFYHLFRYFILFALGPLYIFRNLFIFSQVFYSFCLGAPLLYLLVRPRSNWSDPFCWPLYVHILYLHYYSA